MQYIEKYVIYSATGTPHIVSLCDDGSYACDCIGWISHYPRNNCKHIREAIYNKPTPINRDNWESLKGNKQKVKATLAFLSKMVEAEKSQNPGNVD